jgi:hypothetical protein
MMQPQGNGTYGAGGKRKRMDSMKQKESNEANATTIGPGKQLNSHDIENIDACILTYFNIFRDENTYNHYAM